MCMIEQFCIDFMIAFFIKKKIELFVESINVSTLYKYADTVPLFPIGTYRIIRYMSEHLVKTVITVFTSELSSDKDCV